MLATESEEEIARWFWEYGDERHSRRIARAIVEERRRVPLRRTSDLVRIVERVVPRGAAGRSRINLATRTFQGLRIRVNRELDDIAAVLPPCFDLLVPGGRIVVLAYHSLEQRVLKAFIRERERSRELKKVNSKLIAATARERRRNPRSRSARLRAIEKIKAIEQESDR